MDLSRSFVASAEMSTIAVEPLGSVPPLARERQVVVWVLEVPYVLANCCSPCPPGQAGRSGRIRPAPSRGPAAPACTAVGGFPPLEAQPPPVMRLTSVVVLARVAYVDVAGVIDVIWVEPVTGGEYDVSAAVRDQAAAEAGDDPLAPPAPVARFASAVVPLMRSRTYTSGSVVGSPGLKFVANEMNDTRHTSAEIVGWSLPWFPAGPEPPAPGHQRRRGRLEVAHVDV